MSGIMLTMFCTTTLFPPSVEVFVMGGGGDAVTTGNITLAVNGVATAIKVESAVWLISGAGVS